MTVNEMLILVRQRLNDMEKTTFSDEELIHVLNDAMDSICVDMSESYDPDLLKTIELNTTGVKLPDDFIAWQGQFALTYLPNSDGDTVITPMDGEWDGENATLKYFAFKKHVSNLTDKIPFRTSVHLKKLMNQCITEIKGGNTNNSKGTSDTDRNSGAS